jgi:peptide/nickel transport system permease protein
MAQTGAELQGAAPGESAGPGRLRENWQTFNRIGRIERAALIGLAFLTLVALIGPLVVPDDPQLRVAAAFQGPTWTHPFGTDDIGRDLLSRVVLGVRLTWLPGLAVIGVGALVGTTIGLVSGTYGGAIDMVLQRLTDLFLVLPSTLIAIAVVAALGPGLLNTLIAVSVFWWSWYSRVVRGEARAIAARPHVEAARLAGASQWRLLTRYILPGVIPSVLVLATLDVANIVLILSLFSFLGLGAPAPAPELGAMTARSLNSLTTSWWLPMFPALGIFLLAFTANLAGDGLRDLMKTT